MNAISVSQTDLCDAISRVNVTSEPNSDFDTPIPTFRFSVETTDTLKSVSTRLQGLTSSIVIYLISCKKCHKHYVGERSRTLRKRMYEHKASAQKDGQITPVS